MSKLMTPAGVAFRNSWAVMRCKGQADKWEAIDQNREEGNADCNRLAPRVGIPSDANYTVNMAAAPFTLAKETAEVGAAGLAGRWGRHGPSPGAEDHKYSADILAARVILRRARAAEPCNDRTDPAHNLTASSTLFDWRGTDGAAAVARQRLMAHAEAAAASRNAIDGHPTRSTQYCLGEDDEEGEEEEDDEEDDEEDVKEFNPVETSIVRIVGNTEQVGYVTAVRLSADGVTTYNVSLGADRDDAVGDEAIERVNLLRAQLSYWSGNDEDDESYRDYVDQDWTND